MYVQAHGRTGGTAQEWVRNMLGCVGRGGNAQAIRDEILNIMHRNNIGEKRGTWMEVTTCLCFPPLCAFKKCRRVMVLYNQLVLQI